MSLATSSATTSWTASVFQPAEARVLEAVQFLIDPVPARVMLRALEKSVQGYLHHQDELAHDGPLTAHSSRGSSVRRVPPPGQGGKARRRSAAYCRCAPPAAGRSAEQSRTGRILPKAGNHGMMAGLDDATGSILPNGAVQMKQFNG
ncbi:hypothetical protein ASPU41_17320 [Arthrobacter sp. U41]|nr:hypothetical protein ASPU41_17320 [Arthrobacter sp. U41]